MAETTMSDALKNATEAVQDRVESLKDAARYQVRKNMPEAERALKTGYQDAADVIRQASGSGAVRAGVAIGLLGLVAGLLLSRR